MSDRPKVKNDCTLERDVITSAIINTDVSSYENMLIRRKAFLEKDHTIHMLQTDVLNLKEMMLSMQQQIQNLITINTIK